MLPIFVIKNKDWIYWKEIPKPANFQKIKTLFFYSKSIDFPPRIVYNYKCQEGKGVKTSEQDFLKKLKKPIDKIKIICYNKYIS